MFKVHEKFNCRDVWIRASEILQVFRSEDDDYTVIMFKNGVFIYVSESVEYVLMNIHLKEKRQRLLSSGGVKQ